MKESIGSLFEDYLNPENDEMSKEKTEEAIADQIV